MWLWIRLNCLVCQDVDVFTGVSFALKKIKSDRVSLKASISGWSRAIYCLLVKDNALGFCRVAVKPCVWYYRMFDNCIKNNFLQRYGRDTTLQVLFLLSESQLVPFSSFVCPLL